MNTKPKFRIPESLSSLLRERHLSQSDVASALGVSPQAVQQWCSGRTVPRYRRVLALSKLFEVPVHRILYGKDASTPPPANPASDDEYVSVPADGGAGDTADGDTGDNSQIIAKMVVNASWLRGRTGVLDVNHFRLYPVDDDSMKPLLNHHDLCLVDTRYDTISRDGIYVITCGGETRIRRVIKRFGGTGLIIESENPAYPTVNIEPSAERPLYVHGRCVMACQFENL